LLGFRSEQSADDAVAPRSKRRETAISAPSERKHVHNAGSCNLACSRGVARAGANGSPARVSLFCEVLRRELDAMRKATPKLELRQRHLRELLAALDAAE